MTNLATTDARTAHESAEAPFPGTASTLSWCGRLALVGLAAGLAAGFALAASLDPDPRGYGTHQQLGLPPCSLQLFWGVPCPSCGATTAFAYFVRGQWLAAASANLSALGLAMVAAAMIPWSLYSAAIGRCWRVAQPEVVAAWSLGVILTVALTQWLALLVLRLWF